MTGNLIGYLILNRACRFLSHDDMRSGCDSGTFLPGNVSCNTDETPHITQLECEVSLAVRPALGFPDNFINCALVAMRDLAVIFHFLRYEPDIFLTVFWSVVHALCHVDFVPVPANTGAERRVHTLNCIEVAS